MIAAYEVDLEGLAQPEELAMQDTRCPVCRRSVIGRFGGYPHVCQSCDDDVVRIDKQTRADAERMDLA